MAGSSCSACPSDLPMCLENLCSPQQGPPIVPPTTAAPPDGTQSPEELTTKAPPTTIVTPADREEIVLAHNYVRSRVSPTATNMRRMVH